MSVIDVQNLTRDYASGKGIFNVSISVDKGSMVTLLAAPMKRRTVALTQICVLVSGVL